MSEQTSVKARLIGSIFVEKGLINETQLEHALELQRESGTRLGEILVAQFGLSRVELASVLAEQWAEHERAGRAAEAEGAPVGENGQVGGSPTPAAAAEDFDPTVPVDRRPIGEIFVERGFITEPQLEIALETQKQTGERLGEILVANGSLTRLDLAGALAEQWSSLQKLRPPAPKATVPWQQAAPEEAAAADAAARGELDDVRRSLVGVEDRLRLAESALLREPWKDEVRAAVDGAALRLDTLEARLADVVSREEIADISMLSASLTELRTVVDDLRGRADAATAELDGMRGSIAQLPTHDDLSGRIDEAVTGVAGRLASLESRPDGLDEIARIRTELTLGGERLERLEEIDTQTSARIDALSAEVAASGEQARTGSAALEAQVERLAGNADATTARLEEVAARTAETADALSMLRARVDTLPAGFDAAQLESSLADLHSRLEQLRENVPHDVLTRLDSVDRAVAEIDQRLVQTAPGATVARVEEVVERLESQRHDFARRIDEIAAAGEAGASAVREELQGLWMRLQAVEEQAEPREAVPPAALSTLEEELRQRLTVVRDELAARTEETAGRQTELVGEIARLSGRLEEIMAGQAEHAAEGEAGVSALRGELNGLWERLQAVEERAELQVEPRDAVPPAALSTLEEDLRQRLTVVRDELAARTEETAGRQTELAGEIARLSGRLEEIMAGQAEHAAEGAGVSALRGELNGLWERLQAVEEQAELQVEPREAVPPAALSTLEEDLRQRLTAVRDELAARTHETAGRQAELAEELAGLTARLDEIAAAQAHIAPPEAVTGAFAAIREEMASKLDALRRKSGDDVAALAARVDDLHAELRTVETTAADPVDVTALTALSGRLDGLAAEVQRIGVAASVEIDLDGYRAELAALVEQSSSRHAEHTAALEARVSELHSRTEVTYTREEAAADFAAIRGLVHDTAAIAGEQRTTDLSALAARIEEVSQALGAMGSGDEVAAAVEQVRAELSTRIDTRLGQQASDIAALRFELNAIPRQVDGEWRSVLDHYVAELTEQVSARASLADTSLARIESEIASLRESAEAAVDATAAARAADAEQTSISLAALAARIDDMPTDQRVLAGLQHELTMLSNRVDGILAGAAGSAERVAAHDDVLHTIEASMTSLEQATRTAMSTLRAEMEEQFSSMSGAAAAETAPELVDANLAARVRLLEERLESEAERAAEQVRVTEKALRKGLASLGDKLAASESAYAMTGNALRESIDRLGYALVEADARVAERTDDATLEARTAIATSYVAFVPSGGGYKLIVVDDTPPQVGDKVRVSGFEKKLVATRIQRSPLPLDTRPCVYLEVAPKK